MASPLLWLDRDARMKPDRSHIPHRHSRQALEHTLASWQRLAEIWRELSASAKQQGNSQRKERAEFKLVECEAEIMRLHALLLDLDRGR